MLKNRLQSNYTSHFHVLAHSGRADQLFPLRVSIYTDGRLTDIHARDYTIAKAPLQQVTNVIGRVDAQVVRHDNFSAT